MTAAALAYLVAGFSVVATAMGTKRPLFPWIEFQSRRPTAAEMSAWYRRDPRAGRASQAHHQERLSHREVRMDVRPSSRSAVFRWGQHVPWKESLQRQT